DLSAPALPAFEAEPLRLLRQPSGASVARARARRARADRSVRARAGRRVSRPRRLAGRALALARHLHLWLDALPLLLREEPLGRGRGDRRGQVRPRGAGGVVAFLTLTLPHRRRDALVELVDALLGSWTHLIGGRAAAVSANSASRATCAFSTTRWARRV